MHSIGTNIEFFEKRTAITFSVVLIISLLNTYHAVSVSEDITPTRDELAYITSGISETAHLRRQYIVNPPIPKLLAVSCIDQRDRLFPALVARTHKDRVEFMNGTAYAASRPQTICNIVHTARRPFIFASFLLGLSIYLIGKFWSSSNIVGMSAAILWCSDGFLMGQGIQIGSDILATFFVLWALFFCGKWLRSEKVLYAIGTGIFLGLAISSKYSTILAIPTVISSVFIQYFASKSSQKLSVKKILDLTVVSVVLPITILYMLHLDDEFAVTCLKSGCEDYICSSNCSASKTLMLPIPKSVAMGIQLQTSHTFRTTPLMVGCVVYHEKPYWHLPFAILVRSSLAVLFLVVMLGFCFFSKKFLLLENLFPQALPLSIFSVALLVCFAFAQNDPLVRYIIPALPLFYVLAAWNACIYYPRILFAIILSTAILNLTFHRIHPASENLIAKNLYPYGSSLGGQEYETGAISFSRINDCPPRIGIHMSTPCDVSDIDNRLIHLDKKQVIDLFSENRWPKDIHTAIVGPSSYFELCDDAATSGIPPLDELNKKENCVYCNGMIILTR